jgi:hypothetical protein
MPLIKLDTLARALLNIIIYKIVQDQLPVIYYQLSFNYNTISIQVRDNLEYPDYHKKSGRKIPPLFSFNYLLRDITLL